MNVQLWTATAVVVLGYIVGFYFQNRRIDDFRSEINHRFDDLKDWVQAELATLRAEFATLRSELTRIDERLERLEHPVPRP